MFERVFNCITKCDNDYIFNYIINNRFITKCDNKYDDASYCNYIFDRTTVNRFIFIKYDKSDVIVLLRSIVNSIINCNITINLILKINLLK